MMRQNLELDATVLKTAEDLTFLKTDRSIVKIDRDTLAVALKIEGRQRGYIFHGQCKLLVDTIVETEEGAVGKSVEMEIDKPFLMLGKAEEQQGHFSIAENRDLAIKGYRSPKEFTDKAQELLDRFFKRGMMGDCPCYGEGEVFAFPNKDETLDVLMLKGSKLTCKIAKMMFVSDANKAVLKSGEQIVVSTHGRACIVKR